MPPTAPAAPVTRIGLSCLWFAVMSLTLGDAQKTNWIAEAKDWMKRLAATARGGRSPTVVHAVVCRKGGGQPWSIFCIDVQVSANPRVSQTLYPERKSLVFRSRRI